MNTRSLAVKLAVAVSVLVAVLAALTLVPVRQDDAKTGEVWTCSMHPEIRLPARGQCPICGMDLIPVSQLTSAQAQLDERIGLETEPAQPRELWKEIRTVGRLDFNERRVAVISARIAGRIDRVYADFTGLEVKRGDHLVDIYSPDLFTAQRELLVAAEARTGDTILLEATRQKLLLWGLLPEQITEFEATKKPRTHVTLYAPQGGIVIEKAIREGQYVKDGDVLYRVAELDPIWLYLQVYEYDVAWVRRAQTVDVTLEAFPGERFQGVVVFIDPVLDDPTRTVRVRVNLPNPDRRLKPSMYATARIRAAVRADGKPAPTGLEGKFVCPMHPEVVQEKPGQCPICGMALEKVPGDKVEAAAGKVLAVRATAVLDTGERRVVYRRTKDGAYELREVVLGPRSEGLDDAGRRATWFPVVSGLEPGDEVVVRGGFLLDSQRQLEGMPSLFFPQGRAGASLHSDHGGGHGSGHGGH